MKFIYLYIFKLGFLDGYPGFIYAILQAFYELQISLKPNAEKIGLTLGEISRQLRQAYYGEEAQRLPREGDDV